jgi:hypothetical protein
MTPTTDDLNRNEKREIFGSALMEAMAKIECTLGIDSTDEEKEKVKQQQLIYLSKIKELDPVKYDILKKVL